jgi:RecB family exonuclease
MWHQLMENHYQNLNPWADVDTTNSDTAELVGWMYDGYIDHYRTQDDWVEVVSVEEPFEIDLDPDGSYRLKGRLDLLVTDRNNRLWIVDHKSGANLPNDRDLAYDDQFGLYMWAMRQLGRSVFGMCWNAALTRRNIRKPQLLEDRFRRIYMHRTDRELATIADETLQMVRNIYETGADWRTPDTRTCKYMCDYSEPCLLGRKEGPQVELDALEAYGFKIDMERH